MDFLKKFESLLLITTFLGHFIILYDTFFVSSSQKIHRFFMGLLHRYGFYL